jgi:hypothetical protein
MFLEEVKVRLWPMAAMLAQAGPGLLPTFDTQRHHLRTGKVCSLQSREGLHNLRCACVM